MLAVCASGLEAQSITLGSLGGIVQDSTGASIPGALVTLTDEIAGSYRTVAVAGDGTFDFSLLERGRYEVRAEQIGYRPVVVRDIRVEPGAHPVITVILPADTLPVTRIDTLHLGGPAFASDPGASTMLPRDLVQRFATERYGLSSLDSFMTTAAGDWGLDGLPGSATGAVIDGLPYDVARSPWLPLADRFGPAFPRAAFAEMGAEPAPLDVEWGDFAGGAASAATRRGSNEVTAQAYGDWAPAALASSRFFDTGTLNPQTFLGGLVIAGPVVRDTANFVIGG